MLYIIILSSLVVVYAIWKTINYYLTPTNIRSIKVTYDDGTVKTYNDKHQLHSFNDEPAVILNNGSKYWYKEDLLHRDNNKPAVEHADGSKVYYNNGNSYILKPNLLLCRKETNENGTIRTYNKLTNQLHSFNDEPASIHTDGSKLWYKEGKLHRDNDLPAIVHANGDKHWCKNDKLHRDNDLPAFECANGMKEWYKEGKKYKPDLCRKETDKDGKVLTYNKLTNQLHSFNDEPAILCPSGTKCWYKDGKCHRDNNLPAVEYANGGKSWYKEGKIMASQQAR